MVLWKSGVETGDFTEFSGIYENATGAIDVVATNHHGSYGVNVTGLAVNDDAFAHIAVASQTTLWTALQFKLNYAMGDYKRLLILDLLEGTSFGTMIGGMELYHATDTEYYCRVRKDIGGYDDDQALLIVDPSDWNLWKIKFVRSATVGVLTTYINGVEMGSLTTLDTSGVTGCDRVRFGVFNNPEAFNFLMDCMVVDSSDITDDPYTAVGGLSKAVNSAILDILLS